MLNPVSHQDRPHRLAAAPGLGVAWAGSPSPASNAGPLLSASSRPGIAQCLPQLGLTLLVGHRTTVFFSVFLLLGLLAHLSG